MMGQMAGSMGLPGMGLMSKKARGRQMQAQSKKGKKGKGKKAAPARRPVGPGGVAGAPAGGNPFGGGLPGGMPGLPPGQSLPDLCKLNFDQFKDQPGR
jgi:signal recognition particle subunit SRP54